MNNCPLCYSSGPTLYFQDKNRDYFQCRYCDLVYVDRNQLLTPDLEKRRYQQHQNTGEDAGYESYLSEICKKILPWLDFGDKGLDFGCGESKLLSQLLTQNAHSADSYDLYFYPDEEVWKRRYDFVVMSEVIEHLRGPRETLQDLKYILNNPGKIFIKTKFLPEDKSKFGDWFYKRDLTHIQFFNSKSINYIKQELGFHRYEELGNDLYLISN